MKLLFICGSIEPGQDGVGDYTRELAGSLRSRGVEVMILALMDRSVNGIKYQNQTGGQQTIATLRIEAKLSDSERRGAYIKLLSEFKPDIISLQYVPYAFSAKGLPFGLSKILDTNSVQVKWHFMIHEAYVWHDLRFKRKVLSVLQVQILKKLVRTFEPVRIHTSIPFYQKLLSEIAIKSDILGLFGNIHILPDQLAIQKSRIVQGVYFGSGPLAQNFHTFSEGIKNYSLRKSEKINLVFCGIPDFRTLEFIKYLKKDFEGMNIEIIEYGPLSPAELSALFLKSQFGISRESEMLIGKSGTAITMLEHGLPLWVPLSKDNKNEKNKFDFRGDQCISNLDEIEAPFFRDGFKPESRLDAISAKFLNSLPVSLI